MYLNVIYNRNSYLDQDGNIFALKIQPLRPLLVHFAASIGTEVKRYYCRAKLFGSKYGLSMQVYPLAGRPVSSLTIPNGGECDNSSTIFTSATNTSVKIRNKVEEWYCANQLTTTQQNNVCLMSNVLFLCSMKYKQSKRVALATKY
jgi:hypothetical protein